MFWLISLQIFLEHMLCMIQQSDVFTSHWWVCIYMWRIHLESTCVFSHSAPTLCWSVSHFHSLFFFFNPCLLSYKSVLYMYIYSRIPPSVPETRQETDSSPIRRPRFVFGTWKWEQGPDTKNNVVAEAELHCYQCWCRVSLLSVSVTSALHCAHCRGDVLLVEQWLNYRGRAVFTYLYCNIRSVYVRPK